MKKEFKVIASTWFTPMGGSTIGVVAVETEYDGLCFYIGLGLGYDEKRDEQLIAERGARFPYGAGVELLGVEI